MTGPVVDPPAAVSPAAAAPPVTDPPTEVPPADLPPAADGPKDRRLTAENARRRTDLAAAQVEIQTLKATLADREAAAAATVEAGHRDAILERLCAAAPPPNGPGPMIDPADLLDLVGVQVADMLDDAGDVDPDKVDAALAAAAAARPYLFVQHGRVDPITAAMSGHQTSNAPTGNDLHAALNQAAGGRRRSI